MRSILLLLAALLLQSCDPSTPPLPPEGPGPVIDGVRFVPGNWVHDLPSGEAGASRGYHRVVVEIDSAAASAPAVLAILPWRRPDADPQTKDVLVFDAAGDGPVVDRITVRVTGDEGAVIFRPNPGSTVYHLYYLPYETGGGYYPNVTWRPPTVTADPAWAASVGEPAVLPQATAVAVEWQDDFHSFFPMQVAATVHETRGIADDAGGPFVLFPEDRLRPIRMRDRIPFHWAATGPSDRFEGAARPGEAYTFQLGAWAVRDTVRDVRVTFGTFTLDGEELPATALTCFNLAGIDEAGRPFTKRVDVPAGEVQPLWIGVDLPDRAGLVEGTVTVSAGTAASTVAVSVRVGGPAAVNRGFNEPENQSRLAWLNSTVGSDPDYVVPPYEPVAVEGATLRVLGREIRLGAEGLPDAIASRFTPEMTSIGEVDHPVLAAPIRFDAVVSGAREPWTSEAFTPASVAKGRAEWAVASRSASFDLETLGAIEYDGMIEVQLRLVARRNVTVDDLRLTIPYAPEAATWMLGLGRRGGRTPESVDWTWNVENHQEGAWLGDVNRGLQYVLRDPGYVRPLNTNFYRNQPLRLPDAWVNGGRGGIRIRRTADAVEALNYSGPRSLAAGDTLHFTVRFLVTPFRALDTRSHFATRFVHQYVPVDTVKAWGGTVVNIHHANAINPYINYPFYALEEQKAYIDEAHAKGVKVKLYNTIRELTYRAHELFALRSLGDEILNGGEGGGHPWLQEHLGSDYHSAWHAYTVDDAAILDKGTSRWTNYYVEGLKWLAEYQRIDGLYLDDIAFSRETVKRIVNVLHEHRDEVVIDLHSANQYNVRDGWTNSAFLYMEHFPYVSRLWFGEYFDYSSDPDFWLTEVSGIPFGLMGEMLQDGGHPFRGLLHGMTSRKYGDTDPRPVWAMMTDFGIEDSRMLGYWLDPPPVTVDNPLVRATAYVRPDGAALVVLASWAAVDQTVRLSFDTRVASDPGRLDLRAPAVEGLQPEARYGLGEAVRIPANQGLFLLLEPR